MVGPDRTPFIIHKELLCDSSPYFAAALKGDFKEAKDNTVELLDDDVTVFKYFQIWLYSGKISSQDDVSFRIIFQLYCFSDLRQIPDLQNAAVNAIIGRQTRTSHIPVGMIPYVYGNTPPNTRVRCYLLICVRT